MKKLLVFRFLASVFLVSSAVSHAAEEREQENSVPPALQAWYLHRACSDYNFPGIERLLDAGATDIPGCSNLLNAIMSDTPESVQVVELLINKGSSVAPVDGVNPLECALGWEMPFDYKKAKVEALLEAGVYVDWNKIQEAVTAAQRRGSWSKHLLTPDEWDMLALIMNKVEDDRQLTAIVYPVLLEQLPVDGVADLVGQYMHPYWDGRNQTPEAAQKLEDGGENQESESAQEQESGEQAE